MSTSVAAPPLASTLPSVRQTRLIRASRQAVYDAWTQPEIFSKWWGPADHVITAAELDVREGGHFSFTDEALPHAPVPPGFPRSMTGTGVYTEVLPLERLQFTMKASWNPGESSLITVTFRDADLGTELTILHEKLPAGTAHLFNAGWNSTLDKLVALLAPETPTHITH
jgi:uncharacterized protein YndB with AHSA1/START domain